GANPGPKCYRRGGPLAVTDANVMVGKLIPDFFPKIFGAGQNLPLDAGTVRSAFAAMAETIGDGRSGEQVADGFIKIAVENMANAIKKISVQRGYDVTRYALNCFGGAGGQHACLVADALGMESVLIHPLSSLLSAYGMGLADIRSVRQQAIEETFGVKAHATLKSVARRLARETRDEVAGQGVPAGKIAAHVRAHIRYAGTDTPLIVEAGSDRAPASLAKLQSAFERAHKAQFGFIDRKKGLVIEAVSVEAVGGGATFEEKKRKTTRAKLLAPARRTRFFSGGKWHKAKVYRRDQLLPGHKVKGPAIVIEPHQTVVVEHGWQAELTAKNHLVLRRVAKLARAHAIGTKADPVMLEVFNNLFMSIAEQMGVALQNTAYSVNIKERLDFSCAVFDGNGSLVANAPHMPVHLGSMDRAVETVIRENKGKVRPGDVYAINAPYNGGTHLPDITVCTPVFDGKKILFWVASRGHHADVGGISPGSMSPNATTIEEEGVYIDNFKLVERGRFRERETYALLEGAKYPARNPLQNVNDIKAQIAANEMGVHELRKMVRYFTLPVVRAYMLHVQDNAAESVRRVIDRLHDSAFTIETDQGNRISVRISVDKKKREATVDFTGTSPQQPSNFNAPEP
ncbi:MAG: hydantoinase B/oxoprolinase family protein, partial [Xanthobacteraceae bacterium]